MILAILILLPGLSCGKCSFIITKCQNPNKTFPFIAGFLKPSDTMCKLIDTTESTCSVTHGGNVFLQVMSSASDHRLQFKKQLSSGSKEVFTIKERTLKIREDSFKNRTEAFMDNGTIKIQNVQWEDVGKYKVEIYDTNGANLETVEITFPHLLMIIPHVACF
uniref:Immunoglobulin subtype domain-containing protein n=1 Tax=Periophthalmus magnuspinnatus TaxID=409849 RepID=A0A3B4AX37_9GOBI